MNLCSKATYAYHTFIPPTFLIISTAYHKHILPQPSSIASVPITVDYKTVYCLECRDDEWHMA